MHIYCPFCETPYDIDESLVPDGNIKVRCKHCSIIFILNKETGAAKGTSAIDEINKEIVENNIIISAKFSEDEFKTEYQKNENPNFYIDQSILEEINQAVEADEFSEEDKAEGLNKEKPGKKSLYKVITVIILILSFIVLILAAIVLIDYNNKINLPFFNIIVNSIKDLINKLNTT